MCIFARQPAPVTYRQQYHPTRLWKANLLQLRAYIRGDDGANAAEYYRKYGSTRNLLVPPSI